MTIGKSRLGYGALVLAIVGLLMAAGPLPAGQPAGAPDVRPLDVVPVDTSPDSAWMSAFLLVRPGQTLLVGRLGPEAHGPVPLVLVAKDAGSGTVRAYFRTVIVPESIEGARTVSLTVPGSFAQGPGLTLLLSDTNGSLGLQEEPTVRAMEDSVPYDPECDCACCANLAQTLCQNGVHSFSCGSDGCSFTCN